MEEALSSASDLQKGNKYYQKEIKNKDNYVVLLVSSKWWLIF